MSTYWGFHCKTCPRDDSERGEYDYDRAYSDIWMNHGEDTLRNVARLASHFVAIQEGDTTGYIEIRVMGYGSAPIDWAIAHVGHDIELHSEYGDLKPIEEPAS